MKISSTNMPAQRCQSLVINLLLIVLFFSSVTSGNAKIQAGQTKEKPGPTSIHRQECPAQSRADFVYRTAPCGRTFQTEPQQTFVTPLWTGVRKSRAAPGLD
jgi:hypothetical protein